VIADRMVRMLHRVGRALPWTPRRGRASDGGDASGRLVDGVEVVGFIRSEIGIGQAARLLHHAMESAGIPLSARDLPIAGRAGERSFDAKLSAWVPRRVSVSVTGLDRAGVGRWPRRPGTLRVAYPFWELPEVPRAFRRDLLSLDAAWAPSTLIAGALRSVGVDASLVRQPVGIPPDARLVPLRAGDEPLAVLTYLDFDSFPARKNVRAAVTAFQRAFPPGHPASLTVKVRGIAGVDDRAWLAAQAAGDRRIRVIDATLPWSQVEELVRACDVFLSMHRSEGFGFGAAEAMAHAKAVVSTDHGGTTDFVTGSTGFPVACSLVPVRRGEYPAWRGQRWAEPSIEHAAELLRSIDVDRASAAERGRLGRGWMEEHHSPAAVGRSIRAWLTARGWLGQEALP